MPLVWEQLQKLGLSPDTIDILMASWRKSTRKQYATYLSRWVTYCKTKQLDVTHATINDGLDFLTLLYKHRVGYSAINTARYSLSSAITPADKKTFGKHPLVTCFLKGTFELRPSLPTTLALFSHTFDHFRPWWLDIKTTYAESYNVTCPCHHAANSNTLQTGHLMYAGNHDQNYLHYTGHLENNSTWQTPCAHSNSTIHPRLLSLPGNLHQTLHHENAFADQLHCG